MPVFLIPWASLTHAGTISFNLELTGTRLTLINTGDSTAFFPRALSMHADGHWQSALPPSGQSAPTQLPPGARMDLVWPDARPLDLLSPLERLRPTMVRFFDQAGVGFGQISFFTTPPDAEAKIAADYSDGVLRLSPPKDDAVRATWVLWPQEEGIAGISTSLKADASQPQAQRIDWSKEKSAGLATGQAMPSVILVHETTQGFRLQRTGSGIESGNQQRSQWLMASRAFHALAAVLAAMAIALVMRKFRKAAP